MVRRFLVSIVFLVAGSSFGATAFAASTSTMSNYDLERSTIAVVYDDANYLDALAVIEPKPPAGEPPIDWASNAFHVANQVGQSWRTAADTYRHIDPGRRLTI